jgi:predicted Zn-dependent peptidase
MAGASHFLEHMLFKGTKRWPTARELSETIEGVGGVLNASTDREMTVYWCKVARPYMESSWNVLADMMRNPLMDSEELEKERDVVLEELRMTYDHPAAKLDLLMDQTMWPEQPMGRDVGGSLDSVRGISRDRIMEYMHSQYNPANTVVAVAGNVSHDEVAALVDETLGGWTSGDAIDWFPVVNGQSEPRISHEYKKTDQAHLCVGVHSLPLGHPDRFALGLLNVILGEGMSSRLFVEVREKRGLAYDVHSSLNLFRDCGSFTVYCGVEPQKSESAISAIMEQLSGLREGIPETELNKARELTKGRMLLRMEDSRATAMWIGAQEKLLGRVRTVDEVVGLLDSITTDDLERVAEDLIQEDQLSLALVGPYRSSKRFRNLLKL